ncbi:MAG: class I SAM-dependent methyltransferase [Gammaproteobacteria bacterium]|nr:class I SAM-dependent methyltransferase [Gammaproteobacteria bacterium]
MSTRTLSLTDDLYRYLLATGVRESDVARRLREATATLPMARMQISPEQGAFMQLLVRLIGARRTLEVGTFTGYSALVVAETLPPDGTILACDVSAEWTAIGRPYWEQAGVAARIDLRLAPALDTLDAVLAQGGAHRFDFAFIDADKANYDGYYERALSLLRTGGLIAIDNTLWGGAVIDTARQDPDTAAIRALNLKLRHDPRVDMVLVPIGDGLMLARKR